MARECLFCHGRGIAWDYYNNTYWDRCCLICGGTGQEEIGGDPVTLEARRESAEPAEAAVRVGCEHQPLAISNEVKRQNKLISCVN